MPPGSRKQAPLLYDAVEGAKAFSASSRSRQWIQNERKYERKCGRKYKAKNGRKYARKFGTKYARKCGRKCGGKYGSCRM